MLVTERMQALGDHARSSRQPPVKERKYAQADQTAAEDDVIVEEKLETAEERPAAHPIANTAAAQTPAHETSGNDATDSQAAPEDEDLAAAKRAIIHEWENWSALNPDEVNDPDVAEYFFRHLETKKQHLLNFSSSDTRTIVRNSLGHFR